MKDAIEPEEYKLIKAEAEKQITILENKVTTYNQAVKNIDSILDNAANALSRLDTLYETGDLKLKREIIGSIFSEKLIFDDGHYRTEKVNEVAELIYLINKDLASKKNGTSLDFSSLSHNVIPLGFEPSPKTSD